MSEFSGGQVAAFRVLGWTLRARPCKDPTIRPVSEDGQVKEVRCGCGYSGFNAVGMDAEYERHRSRAAKVSSR